MTYFTESNAENSFGGIRKYENTDFSTLCEMRADANLQHLLLGYPDQKTPTEKSVHDWIMRRMNDPNGIFFIISSRKNKCAGYIQLSNIHHKGHFGYVGIALVEKYRGIGFGGAAMHALMSHAKTNLNINKIMLEVRADNKVALSLYGKQKFRSVGILARHYDDGQALHDVVLMERHL